MPALVAALVLLGVSVALAGRPSRGRGPEPSRAPTPTPAPAASTAAPTTTESPDASRDGRAPGRPTPRLRPEEDGSCAAALGTGETPFARDRGPERAIERVSENCERNPEAAGLLRALARLGRERAQQPRGWESEAGRGRAPEREQGRAERERDAGAARPGRRAEASNADGHPTPGGPGRAHR